MRGHLVALAVLCLVFGASQTGMARDLTKESEASLRAEMQKIRQELERRGGSAKTASRRGDRGNASAPGRGQVYVDDVDPTFDPSSLATKNKAPTQTLFIRSDPLDAFGLLYPLTIGDGKGASFSYLNNMLSDTQAFTVKGYGSVIAKREFLETADRPLEGGPRLSAYAISPFIYGDGTLNTPRKLSEKSALQAGLDMQFEVYGGGLFNLQNIGVRPYFQTDFRGEGQIYGATLLWEPYQSSLHLGSRNDVAAPKVLGLLWRAVAEANLLRVEDAGLSAFTSKRDYAFLGGTLQARAILFENNPDVPTFLCGRIFANASLLQFWDAADKGRGYRDVELEAGYLLSPEVTQSNRFCNGARSAADSQVEASRLKTSVSFVYNNGTNRYTLEKRDQYKVQLNIQY